MAIESLLNFLPEFVSDAFSDSLELIPLLFVVFVFVEILENYFSHKESVILKYSKKFGPLLGAMLAIIPQCGFSVIASMLYIKKLISMGSLIAIYIATSDEAIPILIATPSKAHYLIPLLSAKFIIAVIVGYSIDLLFHKSYKSVVDSTPETDFDVDHIDVDACCNHNLSGKSKWSLIIHPIKHTFNIWAFILLVCIALNYVFFKFGAQNIASYTLQNTIFQPILAAFFGLIPNCAISVVITVMFMSGALSFASTVAGLASNAGLGILVLLKNNTSFKNSMLVLSLLLISAITSGIILQLLQLAF